MKIKTHSGLKKRLKVRKSGAATVQKSCRNHLLDNKSKGQKGAFSSGYPVSTTRLVPLRRLMCGKLPLQSRRKVTRAAADAEKAA